MTYDELLVAALNVLEVDTPELRTDFPNQVERAQLRIQRELDLNTSRRFFEATLNQGVPEVSLPTGTVVVRAVYTQQPSRNNALDGLLHKDRSFLIDFDPTQVAQGDPRYYSFLDDDSIRVVPAPSADVTIQASITVRIPVLAPDTQSNWLSTEAPDLLLYAVLVEAAIFNKMAQEDISAYEGRYVGIRDGVGNEVMRRNRTDEYRESTPKL